jgi:hypothetical protein
VQVEAPVSDERQQCYDLGDPFSVMGVSFFDREFVCSTVPLANLESIDVYLTTTLKTLLVRGHKTFSKTVEAASSTKPKLRETNICDMVYNFRPNGKSAKTKTLKSAATSWQLSFVLPDPTTMPCLVCSSQEGPRVSLPRTYRQHGEIPPAHGGLPAPLDFARSLQPILLSSSQKFTVSMPIAPKAGARAQIQDMSIPPLPDATTTAAETSFALDELLPLLNAGEVEVH